MAVFTAADFGIEERPTMGDPELRKRVQQEVERLTGGLGILGSWTVNDWLNCLGILGLIGCRVVHFVQRHGQCESLLCGAFPNRGVC